MRGHLGFKVKAKIFTPFAVILYSDGSPVTYLTPPGATGLKAYSIGSGGAGGLDSGAGGIAYKSWSGITPGEVITCVTVGVPLEFVSSYSIYESRILFRGTTLVGASGLPSIEIRDYIQMTTGFGGWVYGMAGYARVIGDESNSQTSFGVWGSSYTSGGATVYKGGPLNDGQIQNTVSRTPAGDLIATLLSSASLAGENIVEDDGEPPAFGSGGCYVPYYGGGTSTLLDPGIGGGGGYGGGSHAFLLHFT